jgi:hypothetical protein
MKGELGIVAVSSIEKCRSTREIQMKIGQRVRIIGIPPNIPQDEEFNTREIFVRCLGRVFTIASIFDAPEHPMMGLDIGEVLGKKPYMETIYVEPEYLELVDN